MDSHYAALKRQGLHSKPERWHPPFREQTGRNINTAVNGIAKALRLIDARGKGPS
jgi:hypothetical protein